MSDTTTLEPSTSTTSTKAPPVAEYDFEPKSEGTQEISPDDSPTPMLDRALKHAKFSTSSEGYSIAKQGIQALLKNLVHRNKSVRRIDKTAIDAMIVDIDKKISAQVNQIMHEPAFQNLESAWRGLKYLVDNVDFRQNVRVEMLNATKEELKEDFEDSPEVPKSGLYNIVYSSAYGVFGGRPYGVICGNYDFDPGSEDLGLLRKFAAISAMAHCPFITNASPKFFGEDSFEPLPRMKDLRTLFEGPQYANWHSFRDCDDARNVGLCMPRFLLRTPYSQDGTEARSFAFEEDSVGHHERYLWGHSSIAFTTRVADSFAKYRWCPNIIGPTSGGQVDNLPLHLYEAMGELRTKIPTEIQLTDSREFELSELGFIGLVFRKESNNACFFSANSPQRPKIFGNTKEGLANATNYRLGTQLPYMFVISRLAHYIKVLQREQIGSWKERTDLENELNNWIRQYVADMENPSPTVRSKRPLRAARVTVQDVPGQPGWYNSRIEVRPHFKYMGANFTLSLVGKLEKQ